MLFNSFEFILLFLPIVVAGFLAIARWGDPRLQIFWLIAASLFFYSWWDPHYLPLVVGSIIVNYACGATFSLLRERGRTRAATAIFAAGIVFNLGLIAWFKYAAFIFGTLDRTLGTAFAVTAVALPIGISFFTFQQIAYLVDLRRGDPFERSFPRYALFILFFPHLIAGPIVHPRVLLPQLADRATFRPSLHNFALGITIFSIGLFKKVVLADPLDTIADPVFEAAERGEAVDSFAAWEGAFAYTFQLYFDFSGYSDMAIGLARLFGVHMPINFASPYKATSMIDFWRRWHVTLSSFLRNYLYIPLGGNRHGPTRRYVNLMVTMLLGGLWHGAGWTFVAWGGLHGLYLVVNHLWRHVRPQPIDRPWSRTVARVVTLLAVVVAWVVFRAESFEGALVVLRAMAALPAEFAAWTRSVALSGSEDVEIDWPNSVMGWFLTIWIPLALAFVWTLPNTQTLTALAERIDVDRIVPRGALGRLHARLRWQPTTGWGVVTGALLAVALLNFNRVSPFLYFQF